MVKTTQLLKIEITTNVKFYKSYIYELFHGLQALKHGVKTHEINYLPNGNVEIIVEGDKSSLWKMINFSKKGPILCSVEELTIQFYQ